MPYRDTLISVDRPPAGPEAPAAFHDPQIPEG
jgi:hypothetical protein